MGGAQSLQMDFCPRVISPFSGMVVASDHIKDMVVFPAPLGPMMPTKSVAPTFMENWLTATRPPKRMVIAHGFPGRDLGSWGSFRRRHGIYGVGICPTGPLCTRTFRRKYFSTLNSCLPKMPTRPQQHEQYQYQGVDNHAVSWPQSLP